MPLCGLRVADSWILRRPINGLVNLVTTRRGVVIFQLMSWGESCYVTCLRDNHEFDVSFLMNLCDNRPTYSPETWFIKKNIFISRRFRSTNLFWKVRAVIILLLQIGQEQGGFMGFLQRVLSRADHHIWFHRSEARDRMAVMNRLVTADAPSISDSYVLLSTNSFSSRLCLNVVAFSKNGLLKMFYINETVSMCTLNICSAIRANESWKRIKEIVQKVNVDEDEVQFITVSKLYSRGSYQIMVRNNWLFSGCASTAVTKLNYLFLSSLKVGTNHNLSVQHI